MKQHSQMHVHSQASAFPDHFTFHSSSRMNQSQVLHGCSLGLWSDNTSPKAACNVKVFLNPDTNMHLHQKPSSCSPSTSCCLTAQLRNKNHYREGNGQLTSGASEKEGGGTLLQAGTITYVSWNHTCLPSKTPAEYIIGLFSPFWLWAAHYLEGKSICLSSGTCREPVKASHLQLSW